MRMTRPFPLDACDAENWDRVGLNCLGARVVWPCQEKQILSPLLSAVGRLNFSPFSLSPDREKATPDLRLESSDKTENPDRFRWPYSTSPTATVIGNSLLHSHVIRSRSRHWVSTTSLAAACGMQKFASDEVSWPPGEPTCTQAGWRGASNLRNKLLWSLYTNSALAFMLRAWLSGWAITTPAIQHSSSGTTL